MANDEQMRDGDCLLTLHYAFGLANIETFIIVSQIWWLQIGTLPDLCSRAWGWDISWGIHTVIYFTDEYCTVAIAYWIICCCSGDVLKDENDDCQFLIFYVVGM